jgi:hypothetical protein
LRLPLRAPEDYASDMKDVTFRLQQLNQKALFVRDEINTCMSASTRKELANKIAADFAGFDRMPLDRKKALMKKYIRKITVHRDEFSDTPRLHIEVKTGMPEMIYQQTNYPAEPKKAKVTPLVTPSKGPLRVVKGGMIGGTAPLPPMASTERSTMGRRSRVRAWKRSSN